MKTPHIPTHFEIGFGTVFVYATLAYTHTKKIETQFRFEVFFAQRIKFLWNWGLETKRG